MLWLDKGSFFKVVLENVEKVISKDTIEAYISKTSNETIQLEQGLSELVQLKIRKQIDYKYYNKEYAKITAELEALNLKRDELLNSKLNDTKHKEKVKYIQQTIGNGNELLTEFDDSLFLFVALIDKVIIKSPKHFRFVFESGIEMEVEM